MRGAVGIDRLRVHQLGESKLREIDRRIEAVAPCSTYVIDRAVISAPFSVSSELMSGLVAIG